MIDAYIYWSGVAFNFTLIPVILWVLWCLVLFPAVEAASMARYYRRIGKVHGIKVHSWFRLFRANYELFGRTFTAQRCSYGYWEGVGRWEVFPAEAENEPRN